MVSPMRRTIFLALFAVLALVPAAAHAASPNDVLRDCFDDGVLQGNYSAAELRAAQKALPTDVDEYSDCRDVLSRALDARTSSSGGNHTSTAGAGGGTGGGGSSTPSAPATATATPDASRLSDTSTQSNKLPAPYTPQEHQAVTDAGKAGADELKLPRHSVVPSARLAASIGRNSVPGLLIVVLAALAAAALALLARPLVRVISHR